MQTQNQIKRTLAQPDHIEYVSRLITSNQMTLLGREAPELPAEVLFSEIELKVLGAYAKKK